MKFIKKYIRILCLLLFVISPITSQAANEIKVPSSNCGVTGKIVDFGNGSICEQDVSFRMIYKMFPTVIETYVFPIIKPEYLGTVKIIEANNLFKYQSQEIVFFEVFKASMNVAHLIIFIFIVWHFLLIGLLRTANDGSFLGNSWKSSSVIAKYIFLTILLLPVTSTGVLIIHVLVLSLIILGIYFANFFWSSYLNFLQNGDEVIHFNALDQANKNEVVYNNDIEKYDHNYLYAYNYAENLVKIALCKRRTEKLVFQSLLPMGTINNVNDIKNCAVNKNISSWDKLENNESATKGFIHYSNMKMPSNLFNNDLISKDFFSTNIITFGNKDLKQCQSVVNKEFSSLNYECGSIIKTNIKKPSKTVTNLMGEINFYDKYKAASLIVMSQSNPNIEKEWNQIRDAILTKYQNDPNFKDRKDESETVLKNISFIFHEMLMNDALIGNTDYEKRVNIIATNPSYTSEPIVDSSLSLIKSSNFNTSPLELKMDMANKIAKTLESIQCVSNPLLYKEAENALSLYNGLKNNNLESTQYSTSCLDVETLTPIGFNPQPFIDVNDNGILLKRKSFAEREETTSDAIVEFNKLIKEIRVKRAAIEKSYFKSLLDLPSNDMVIKLRKEGWGVSGSYMLRLLTEKEADSKALHALRNMTIVKTDNIDEKGLPPLDFNKMFKEETSNTLTEWFDIKSYSINILKKVYPAVSSKSFKFIDVNEYISSSLTDAISDENPNSTFFDEFFDLAFNISTIKYQMKKTIGLSDNNSLSSKNIEACFDDSLLESGDFKCPINLTNPITEISKLGHTLIDTSLNMIVASVSIAIMERAVVFGNAKLNSKSVATVDGLNTSTAKNKNVTNSSKYKFLNGLEKFLSLLSLLASLLLMVSTFILTVGMVMAYVIPLIPFIAFTIAFVSWIIISIEILIIAPIWLAFLFRIEDSNKPSTDLYMAGFNFVMQMLFRPALIVIALTLCWSLFSIIFLIINITIAPLFIMLNSVDGLIMSIITTLLILVSYIVTLYIGIKQVFNLLISLPNGIFSKIGVQPFDSSAEQDAQNKASNFTMAGVGLSSAIGKGTSKVIENASDMRNNAIEKAKENAKSDNETEAKDNKKKKDELDPKDNKKQKKK